MNRRHFLSTFGLGSVGLAHSFQRQEMQDRSRPNIVLLLTDDHHWQNLGTAGNPHVQTPQLDRLAARGVYFSNAICSTPLCGPSRGVLLSGREIYQTGLASNDQPIARDALAPTVIDQVRRAGYQTILVGKWHLAPRPGECGFTDAPLWKEDGADYRNPPLRRGLSGQDETVSGWETDLLTDAAIEAVRNAKQPFLLWLAYTAPHSPWNARSADARYLKLYEGRNRRDIAPPAHPPGGDEFPWEYYYAATSQLDSAIGRFITALEAANLWRNTVVFAVGDNGLMGGTKGVRGKVLPWEESIRVPMIAAGGLVKATKSLDAPVASVDLPATWLDLAGASSVPALAGRSLRSYLETGSGNLDTAFAAWDDAQHEVEGGIRAVPYRVARGRRHKYIVWETGRQALYDWRADPGEQRSIRAADAAQPLAELRERLRERAKNLNDHARAWPHLKD